MKFADAVAAMQSHSIRAGILTELSEHILSYVPTDVDGDVDPLICEVELAGDMEVPADELERMSGVLLEMRDKELAEVKRVRGLSVDGGDDDDKGKGRKRTASVQRTAKTGPRKANQKP